jgi:hypothetical protein
MITIPIPRMKTFHFALLVSLILLSSPALSAATPVIVDSSQDMTFLGGNGSVYLLAEPGELSITVQKRDRNQRRIRTDMRVILAAPDRQIIHDVTIPDDGAEAGSGWGTVQQLSLSTEVQFKGVYLLNITTSRDRYGEHVAWGFKTNCPKYLIETARGHKDERHREPIVLTRKSGPLDVCFQPRSGEFTVAASGLAADVEHLMMFASDGALVADIPVADGQARHTFPGDSERAAIPWRLRVPTGPATLNIDGLTQWQQDDPHPDMALWTNQASSFFPLAAFRWLVAPYSQSVKGLGGDVEEVVFEIHNHSPHQQAIQLSLEFPDSEWSASLGSKQVDLSPHETRQVVVRATVPEQPGEYRCQLRATPASHPGFSTYATLSVVSAPKLDRESPGLPIVLKPFRHEQPQMGYRPAYPRDAEVYFGRNNQPFMHTRNGIATRESGRWHEIAFSSGVRRPDGTKTNESVRTVGSKIAFDQAGNVYLLGRTGRRDVLLCSNDGGVSFVAYPLPPASRSATSLDIEQFSGNNFLEGPPPIVRFVRTKSDPQRIWRRIHDLELVLPEISDGRIAFSQPILISQKCIGLSAHSGIPSSVVSRAGNVHVTWAEATDPEVKVPGVPTYVATYNRESKELGKPALVGYGPPPNDIHNTPSITMDSQGYLHVLVGTHGRPFPFTSSRQPNNAQPSWTKPVVMGEGLRQTYVGLVCGRDDTLHAVFRLWRDGEEPFPASYHATLAYQRKRPGQPWEAPRILLVPPFSEYSVYYHRLTIDQQGRLFLSCDYFSTYWHYRNDQRLRRRSLLTSADGGDTWKLAADEDL